MVNKIILYVSMGLLLLGAVACDGDPPHDPPMLECDYHLGIAPTCAGTIASFCTAAHMYEEVDCAVTGGQCVDGLGCRLCQPHEVSCRLGNVARCSADGESFTTEDVCDVTDGLRCDPATLSCRDFCDTETLGSSYVGCEYYAASTANTLLQAEHEFAVVVANPNSTPVDIVIEQEGAIVETEQVEANGLSTIRLPWTYGLKGALGSVEGPRSALVRDGAYRIRTTQPVTVYQFNPIDFEIPRDCFGEGATGSDGVCNSFTNDASLLLPNHVLGQDYVVVSRAHIRRGRSERPGFFAVIAAASEAVTVEVDFSAHVSASFEQEDASTTLRPYGPGDRGTFDLNPGDVLQFITADLPDGPCPGSSSSGFCDGGPEHDLTGTRIHASGAVSVIGGHDCAFVPFNQMACDHLEESMFPLTAWGASVAMVRTEPFSDEPNVFRVVSGADGNSISFEPDVYESIALDAGEFVEFTAVESFVATGTAALSVAQFTVGQGREGVSSGDPAFTIGVPREQFRDDYIFLAPESFEHNFVNIVAPADAEVTLDGTLVTDWENIGTSGLRGARVRIDGGTHRMTASAPVGITVYGFANYTSYMYPGGLEVERINDVI